MNLEEKIEAYKENRYACPVPPVPPVWWSIYDWIRYIDRDGHWYKRKVEPFPESGND